MSYRVVTYDRAAERMTGSIAIPSHLLSKVKRIAGFQPQDDGLGEYPIGEEQTKLVAQTLGFNPEPGLFFYYVEPYDPPEERGPPSARAGTEPTPANHLRPDTRQKNNATRGVRARR